MSADVFAFLREGEHPASDSPVYMLEFVGAQVRMVIRAIDDLAAGDNFAFDIQRVLEGAAVTLVQAQERIEMLLPIGSENSKKPVRSMQSAAEVAS